MHTNADEFLERRCGQSEELGSRLSLDVDDPRGRREFREIVLAEAARLPKRQQIVATCYIDCFEAVINEGSFRALAEEVSRVTGKQETVAAVKSAWHVANNKIRAELERRGFNFITVE